MFSWPQPWTEHERRRCSTDVLGTERWCSPELQARGPRVEHDPLDGPCEAHLLLGGEPIARERFDFGNRWDGEKGRILEPPAPGGRERSASMELAGAAADALRANLCSVITTESKGVARVVAFDPAPDLARWSARTDGAVLPFLARWLSTAQERRSTSRLAATP